MKIKEQSIKSWVALAIVFMALGTIAELLLLSHYEDNWQLLPIVLIALSMILMVIIRMKRLSWAIQSFKISLLACALSGFLGAYFHLRANLEFEMELHPTQSWTTSFIESLSGALPALAPGSMILFALIGYIYLLLIKQTKLQ